LGVTVFLFATERYINVLIFIPLPTQKNTQVGADFATYYFAAHTARMEGNFYDVNMLNQVASQLGYAPNFLPYYYPPISVYFFYPLTKFNLLMAKLLWFILNHFALMIIICILLLWIPRILSTSKTKIPLLTSIVQCGIILFCITVFFAPIFFNLLIGQINLLVMALILTAFYFERKRFPIWGGIVLGLAAAVKLNPLLLIVWVLWRRRILFGSVAMITFGALMLLGWWLTPRDVFGYWIDNILPSMKFGKHYFSLPIPPDVWFNKSPSQFFFRLFCTIPGTNELTTTGYTSLTIFVYCIILGTFAAGAAPLVQWIKNSFKQKSPNVSTHQSSFSAFNRSESLSLSEDIGDGLALILMLLLPTYCYEHYFVFVLFSLWIMIVWGWVRQNRLQSLLALTFIAFFAIPGQYFHILYESLLRRQIDLWFLDSISPILLVALWVWLTSCVAKEYSKD